MWELGGMVVVCGMTGCGVLNIMDKIQIFFCLGMTSISSNLEVPDAEIVKQQSASYRLVWASVSAHPCAK